jgi:DNA-binding winged helix-turn-helix (wHTH) protein
MNFMGQATILDTNILSFADEYTLDVGRRELVERGVRIRIGARAFDLLVALVKNPGIELSKSRLLSLAWPNLTVDENNLHVQISALRKD